MLLKKPIQINSLTLNNRLVMPPMHTGKSHGGCISDDLCEHYRQRAGQGSVGLIITEFSYICKQGQAGATQLSLASDSDIVLHQKLVKSIHDGGSKAFAQIHHAGSATNPALTGQTTVAPSAVKHPATRYSAVLPRELSGEEIIAIEDLFASAAVRAKMAGYDGVELHAAHGYLLNQFYSPLSNKRTDAYGGTLENRVRIIMETVQKVRVAVGSAFPVAVRLGGCDYMEGGSTIEDAVWASKILVNAGADLIDLSGGMFGFMHSEFKEAGYFKDMSTVVKTALPDTPILVTGGITEVAQAEALLMEGAADLIGVGRALFRNGDWAKSAIAES